MKSEPFPHHPQARPLGSCRCLSKGRCVLFLAFCAPLPPAPIVPWEAFVLALCWKADKHFPSPAARVAPPETTAGGGAASSAPHPPTPYPFQASASAEPCPADPTQTRYCSTLELETMVEIIWPSSPTSQLRSWRPREGKLLASVAQYVWAEPRHFPPRMFSPAELASEGRLGGKQGLEERRGDQALKEQQSLVAAGPWSPISPSGWGLFLCYLILPPPMSELCVQSALQNVGWSILRMLAPCLAQSRGSVHIW